MRYEGCTIIQIVELPQNGNNKFAVRYIGHLKYFEYDFMCKKSLKKFFNDGCYDDGKYILMHINEELGETYKLDAICDYHKGTVNFLIPGKVWIGLVNDVLEKYPNINQEMKITTTNKVNIPKIEQIN